MPLPCAHPSDPGPAALRRLRLVAWLVVFAVILLAWWPRPAWGDTPTLQASGAQLFENHCVGCHINGGNILRRGKTLKLAALLRQGIDGPDAIARIAAAGQGQMSGYAKVLGDGGDQLVAAWVWEQALRDWKPAPPVG
jgi:cytochrome c6